MSKTKLFAVAGRPVIHSHSPQIFNSFFQAQQVDAAYFRITAVNGQEVIQITNAIGLRGFNVTTPFKSEIMKFMDDLSEEALAIGAVNTVVSENGRLTGYNTDYLGVNFTLKYNGVDPTHKKFAILGAGGAARAAAYGALKGEAGRVVLLNRTIEKAKEAARRMGCDYAPLNKIGEILKNSDILISCISTNQRVVGPEMMDRNLIVLDANYKDSQIKSDAEKKGCRFFSGEQWLLNQAIPAFHRFTGLNVAKDIQQDILSTLHEPNAQKPNIALIGFMGSGKTSVGRKLAESIGYKFVDLDSVIEESKGQTISEIFEKNGERAFREIEKNSIKEHIPGSKKHVFSLGGGAVLDGDNRFHIKQHCVCVWLWASIRTSLSQRSITSRPLLNGKNPEKTAHSLLAARIPLYARTSDIVISTESNHPEIIAKRIKDEMDQTI